jgi:hypothetical protein
MIKRVKHRLAVPELARVVASGSEGSHRGDADYERRAAYATASTATVLRAAALR